MGIGKSIHRKTIVMWGNFVAVAFDWFDGERRLWSGFIMLTSYSRRYTRYPTVKGLWGYEFQWTLDSATSGRCNAIQTRTNNKSAAGRPYQSHYAALQLMGPHPGNYRLSSSTDTRVPGNFPVYFSTAKPQN